MTIAYEVRNKPSNKLAGIVILAGGISEAAHAFVETKFKGMPYHIATWTERAEISIPGGEFEVKPIASDFEGVIA